MKRAGLAVGLCLILCLSGGAALIFETLWFRQASLVFGSSVWASSLVIASFMGGLALGNGLCVRFGGRLRRPLLAYAGLEAVVGLTGLGLVVLLPALTPLLAPLFRHLLSHTALLNAVRAAVAFGLMLVPATAMGATLPISVCALSPSEPDFGRRLGRLYGWNTLGAVAGALAGDAVLIEAFGIRGTAIAATLMNVLAAAGAFLLSRGEGARIEAEPAAAAPAPGPRVWRLLGAAFLCGWILLALEVVWFRFLLLFVGSSQLVFAIMLSAVLVGIATGGLATSAWLRWRPECHRNLPLLALAAGVATAMSYVGLADALRPYRGIPLVEAGDIARISLRLMFPVCLVSGMLFTLLGKALRADMPHETATTGALTLANTVGAMVGALCGGFVLLPRLGMEWSFVVLAGAYGGVALLTVSPDPEPTRDGRRKRAYVLGLATAGLAGILLLFPRGLMKNHYLRVAASRWMGDGSRIVAIREGRTETAIYLRADLLGEPAYFRLVTNAFSMSASLPPRQRYMRLFVWWPMALHPRAERALLISYGIGTTAKALTDTAGLTSIDVVDTSRDILELGRLAFAESHPLDDRRVHTHVEDGRFFLLTSDRKYDLITAEPPPPKNAGIVNLYSREYFRLVYDRLAEGGVATYWLPVSQLEPGESKAIIKAFCSAFADCSLWSGFGSEWMLAGTRSARGPRSEEEFTRQWKDPVVGPALRDLGLESPEQLGTAFIADARALEELTRDDAPLTDDRPGRLSSRQPRNNIPFYLSFATPASNRQRFSESAFVRAFWPESLRSRTLAAFEAQALFDRYAWATYGRGPAELSLAHELLTHTPFRAPVLWLLGSSPQLGQIASRAARQGSDDPLVFRHLGLGALADRDYLTAAERFRQAQRDPADVERIAQLRVYAVHQGGERAKAAKLLTESVQAIRTKDSDGWSWLARSCGLEDPFGTAGR